MSDPGPPSPWLYGRTTDLLLGSGGASLALIALLASLGTDALRAFFPLAVLLALFSIPHYGATLVRVYDESDDARRYARVTWGASSVLAVLFVLALDSPWLGSILLTTYLTWSPWHYTAQNYGIVSMTLGRRGLALDDVGRRALRASFQLSFAMTFFAMHGSERAANYTPATHFDTVYSLMRLGIPMSFAQIAIALAGLAYLFCIGLALRSMRRATSGTWAPIAPGVLLMLTQFAWFVLPAAVRASGLGAGAPWFQHVYSEYGFLWIAAAHAVQYLWITSHFHRVAIRSRRTGEGGEKTASPRAQSAIFIAKAAAAGFALWVVPVLMFAPGRLGSLPAESGLALMAAAMINLHHFIVDGAIWKLRSGAVKRELLSDLVEAAKARLGRLPRLAIVFYGIGAISIGVYAATFYETEFGFRRSIREDLPARAAVAIERLALLGQEGPRRHAQLGYYYRNNGEAIEAVRSFRRSNALRENADAWFGLATIYERNERWHLALEALEAAARLGRNNADINYRAGEALRELGRYEEARDAYRRALMRSGDPAELEKIEVGLRAVRSQQ